MAYIIGNNSKNTLTGTTGIDHIYGFGDDDILEGYSGDDWVYGGDGNDQLHGGYGADQLFGGAGNDTYWVIYDGDTITEAEDEGIDTVYAWMDYQLGNNVEKLGMYGTAIHGFGNSLDNDMWGNASNNVIWGYAGNDHLYGGGGDDTLYGGIGNDYLRGDAGADTLVGGVGIDSYIVEDAGDVVTENAGEGTTDAVYAKVSYVLPANVEFLYLLEEGGSIMGIGNSLNNQIVGNSSNNTLNGGDGTDNLHSGGGTDIMYGGDGGDFLWGGGGSVTMYGGAGHDNFFVDGNDTVIEFAGGGIDVVNAWVSYSLGANVEALALVEGSAATHAAGNDLNNNIHGNSNDNAIYGFGGTDFLWGHAGADYFLFTGLNEVDHVLDFSSAEGDKIYLLLDADIGDADDDAFNFIGGADFTGVAGELHFQNGIVEGDVNGDAVADFSIHVNQASLAASDFIL